MGHGTWSSKIWSQVTFSLESIPHTQHPTNSTHGTKIGQSSSLDEDIWLRHGSGTAEWQFSCRSIFYRSSMIFLLLMNFGWGWPWGPKWSAHFSSQWQLRAAESTLLAPRLVGTLTARVTAITALFDVSEAETLSGTTLKVRKQSKYRRSSSDNYI